MKYEFVLPADYEMQGIRDRIQAKGRLFDNCPRIVFKAFALWTETVIEFDAPAVEQTGVRYEIEYLAKGQNWASVLAR